MPCECIFSKCIRFHLSQKCHPSAKTSLVWLFHFVLKLQEASYRKSIWTPPTLGSASPLIYQQGFILLFYDKVYLKTRKLVI